MFTQAVRRICGAAFVHEGGSRLKVGFIGLGFLGSRVARGIIEDGFDTMLYDVNPEATTQFTESNAFKAASIADVGKACDIVGVCVVNDAQVEDVVAGPDGLLAAPMKPGSAIAIHSTVSPITCRRLEALATQAGVGLVDAALTGNHGRDTRIVLVGGDKDVFKRCIPVFQSFATPERIQLVGPVVGSGEVVKLVNNFLLFANMGSAAAALDLGEQLGVPRPVMEATLTNGSGTSQGIKSLLTPSVGAASFVALATKDVTLAMEMAASAGIDVSELAEAAQAGLSAMRARLSS
jgi:3-hydroxyisobutyrate dehydrogenase-like beta-hydroxyacid dehydrogenase